MNDIDDDSIREAISQLQAREVPAGSRGRVLFALQGFETRSTWRWARMPRVVMLSAGALLVGGVALAGVSIVDAINSNVPRESRELAPAASVRAHKSPSHNNQHLSSPEQKAIEVADVPAASVEYPVRALPSDATVAPRRLANERTSLSRADRATAVDFLPQEVDSAFEPDTELAEQVRAYQAAISVTPAGSRVLSLRAFKRRYPTSPFTHEADLNIVAALGETRDAEQQREAARLFLEQHPESERTGEMRKLSESASSSGESKFK